MSATPKWTVKNAGEVLGTYTEAEIRARLANGLIPASATLSTEGIPDTEVTAVFPLNPTDCIWKSYVDRFIEDRTSRQEGQFRRHLENQLNHLKWALVAIGAVLAVALTSSILMNMVAARSQMDSLSKSADCEIRALITNAQMTAEKTADLIATDANDRTRQEIERFTKTAISDAKTQIDKSNDELISGAKKSIGILKEPLVQDVVQYASERIKDEVVITEFRAAMEDVLTNLTGGIEDFNDLYRQIERATARPGLIAPFGGSRENVPAGWLLCDGRRLSQIGPYERLFKVIGHQWADGDVEELDSGKMFRVPDLQGMFLRGIGQHRMYPYAGGEHREVGSLQGCATAFPKSFTIGSSPGLAVHARVVAPERMGQGPRHCVGWVCGDAWLYEYGDVRSAGGTNSHTHSISGGDEETRPRNAAVVWIIKY